MISANSSAASICAQCPQFGNTCSCAFGISLRAVNAPSSGLTRSSRPQVSRVCLRRWCASRQSRPSSAVSGFQKDMPIEAIASRAPGRGGVGVPLLDELVGDQVLVDDHGGDERAQRLAARVAGEVHQPLDALGRVGVEQVEREAAGPHQHQPADPVGVARAPAAWPCRRRGCCRAGAPGRCRARRAARPRGRRRTGSSCRPPRACRRRRSRAGRPGSSGSSRRSAAAPTRSSTRSWRPGRRRAASRAAGRRRARSSSPAS